VRRFFLFPVLGADKDVAPRTIRLPILRLLVVVLIGGAVLAAAAPVWAAESVPTARLPQQFRGNGVTVGWYLSLWKLVLVLLLFWLWVYTVQWVDRDGRDLEIYWELWNPLVFFGGLVGLGVIFVLPVPGLGGFLVRVLLFLLFYGFTIGPYVAKRNQMVPEENKVLTADHLHSCLAAVLAKVGIHIRAEDGAPREGPPIEFIGKSIAHGREDPDRVRVAQRTRGYLSAKELVYDAVVQRATDIHLEPKGDTVQVRYRIDGILRPAEPFDRTTGAAIINIFKVLGAMDIAERRKPQDGSFAAQMDGRELDFRVASQGTTGGEKLSLRILEKDAGMNRLQDLGMREKLREQVRGLVTQPDGMFIVCGPTGAGKSTTLYACLREIDRFTKNIITIEDPIEYQVDNVTQIEINTKAGQTFGQSLRSVLRQDPDVIMIGEIRDQETAKIACQAATTGHMVFSTLHANDAITALFRLLDLGVEPFMVASAMTGILGQRLVRRLCPDCKEPYKPKPEMLKKANLPPERIDVFYRTPKEVQEVCPRCGGTGYYGRTGIFEMLVINDRLRELIRENPSLNVIRQEARKGGMIYLQEDGLRQVIRGTTSVQELMRTVK
jgi:general secretion pathway protein E